MDNTILSEGQPCDHLGCLNHLSHPCEGCGRVGGREPVNEPMTLWEEGNPRMFCSRAEIVTKEPVFLVVLPHREKLVEAILQYGRKEMQAWHYFLLSSELTDKVTEFWPYEFRLRSLKVVPEFGPEWVYLQFDVEAKRITDG